MTYHNCIRALALGFAASLLSISLEAFATETYYDGFTAFSAPTCSSAAGGTITTGTRTATWNTPPGGATEMRVDSVNGEAVFTPPANPSPDGSGTTMFGSFQNTGLGPYPFVYTFQFITIVGGAVVSVSSASIHCVADGAGGFSFVLGGPPPTLENPQPASFQSGIGVLSGWSCNGPYVGVALDSGPVINIPYGSDRADTASVCGASNIKTGFGLLWNFNLLGNGTHAAQLYINGQAIGSAASFTVTRPDGEFLTGASKETTVSDFPVSGTSTTLIWQESQQNFAVESVTP
jgi:hypothetical protein